MRKILAIFAGSASALLVASSVSAQPAGSTQAPMNSSSGYQQSMQHSARHSQSLNYQTPGSSNEAGTALSNLYQARDELNAMHSSARRDKALHDVDAAIDQTRALSSGSGAH